jgi:hypothetical protein
VISPTPTMTGMRSSEIGEAELVIFFFTLIGIGNCVATLLRHCERSEAIHGTAKQVWIASSLRS